LKILFLLGFPNPFPGAAWKRIGFFAEAWSKKGHPVEVLGTFSYETLDKRGTKKIGNENIFNLIFNMGRDNPLVFALNSLISFIVSIYFLLARRPNIVVVSVPTGDSGLGMLVACNLLKVRHVVDYRDEWEDYATCLTNNRWHKFLYFVIKNLAMSLYAKSQQLIAVTPSSMNAVRQRGLTNLTLITNGADTKTFKPSSARKRKTVFTMFYSGYVGHYYRLDVVLKSLRKLVDRKFNNIRLVIAGQGDIGASLSLASELGILGNVEYMGPINDNTRLARLITTADVGIIPYDDNPLWKNSLPAKFFEYCSCGISVIATVYEDSLLAKLIREYEVGMTSPPMDDEKLAESIHQLYTDSLFRETAGKRARSLIEEKFDRNKIAEEFLDLLKISL
jgi:glycosyltransferase involved in cell wall biosynthesis